MAATRGKAKTGKSTSKSSGTARKSGGAASKNSRATGKTGRAASKAGGATAKKSSGTARKTAARGQSKSSVSQITLDHDEIRRWAEERQGEPACVRGTGGRGDIGMLRIDFPGAGTGSQQKLQKISWDDWFEKFDERGLAFLHQDRSAAGRVSRFNKLVSRETAEESGGKGGAKTRRSARA